MMIWKEVSWNHQPDTKLKQLFHATETFSANGDDVFVWELVGLLRQLIRRVLANLLESGHAT